MQCDRLCIQPADTLLSSYCTAWDFNFCFSNYMAPYVYCSLLSLSYNPRFLFSFILVKAHVQDKVERLQNSSVGDGAGFQLFKGLDVRLQPPQAQVFWLPSWLRWFYFYPGFLAVISAAYCSEWGSLNKMQWCHKYRCIPTDWSAWEFLVPLLCLVVCR